MGALTSILLLAMMSFAGLTVGALVMLQARRGRRVDDHPTCRRCRFDLVGLSPDLATCPECGASLRLKRAIRIGNRRAHRPLMIVGAALFLCWLVIGAAGTVHIVGGEGLNKFKPSWILAQEAKFAGAITADAALFELSHRLTTGSLSGDPAAALVKTALARQADPAAAWSNVWGDFLECAWTQGVMTPDERAQYLMNGVTFTMAMRNHLRQGDTPALILTPGAKRLGSSPLVTVGFKLDRLRIGELETHPTLEGVLNVDFAGFTGSRSTDPYPVTPPLGEHQLQAEWTLQLPGEPSPNGTRKLRFDRQVTVVGPDEPPLPLLRGEQMAKDIASRISVQELTQEPGLNSGMFNVTLQHDALPCPVIARLVLRERNVAPGKTPREWSFEAFYMYPSPGTSLNSWNSMSSTATDPFDLDEVDVILVPTPDDAASDPQIMEMWGEEIVIEGVKVKKGGR